MTSEEMDQIVNNISENLEVDQVQEFIGKWKAAIIAHPQAEQIADIFEHEGIIIAGIPCKRSPM